MNPKAVDAPYASRTPPGPGGRRRPGRWERPGGTLGERLARARLVYLLSRHRGPGDWIALGIATIAVAGLLCAAGTGPDQGRLRAPHLNLDYALTSLHAGTAGVPASALVHGGGPALAGVLAPGDLVAVETPESAGWYRVEEVHLVGCRESAPMAAPLVIATPCRAGRNTRVVIAVRSLESGSWT